MSDLRARGAEGGGQASGAVNGDVERDRGGVGADVVAPEAVVVQNGR